MKASVGSKGSSGFEKTDSNEILTFVCRCVQAGGSVVRVPPPAMSDPLDPSALIQRLPSLLPDGQEHLSSQYDAFAALLHTIMINVGFRLVGLDDSSPAEEVANGKLPEGWNRTGPESYAFRYKHEQSSLVFFLKIVKLGNRLLVHGIALEVRNHHHPYVTLVTNRIVVDQSDKTETLDVLASDFLSPSYFPAGPDSGPLVQGFISSARISDFASQYKIKILQKLVPGLRKEGYQEQAER